jgi:hypothetical protein
MPSNMLERPRSTIRKAEARKRARAKKSAEKRKYDVRARQSPEASAAPNPKIEI